MGEKLKKSRDELFLWVCVLRFPHNSNLNAQANRKFSNNLFFVHAIFSFFSCDIRNFSSGHVIYKKISKFCVVCLFVPTFLYSFHFSVEKSHALSFSLSESIQTFHYDLSSPCRRERKEERKEKRG